MAESGPDSQSLATGDGRRSDGDAMMMQVERDDRRLNDE